MNLKKSVTIPDDFLWAVALRGWGSFSAAAPADCQLPGWLSDWPAEKGGWAGACQWFLRGCCPTGQAAQPVVLSSLTACSRLHPRPSRHCVDFPAYSLYPCDLTLAFRTQGHQVPSLGNLRRMQKRFLSPTPLHAVCLLFTPSLFSTCAFRVYASVSSVVNSGAFQ